MMKTCFVTAVDLGNTIKNIEEVLGGFVRSEKSSAIDIVTLNITSIKEASLSEADCVILDSTIFGWVTIRPRLRFFSAVEELAEKLKQVPVKVGLVQDEADHCANLDFMFTKLELDAVFCVRPHMKFELFPVSATERPFFHFLPSYFNRGSDFKIRPLNERKHKFSQRISTYPPFGGLFANEKALFAEKIAEELELLEIEHNIHIGGEYLTGGKWIDELADSKFLVASEGGLGVIDQFGLILDNHIRVPDASFEELLTMTKTRVEVRPLPGISPRIFEAITVGTIPLLKPGYYSGLLKPWRNYIPLEREYLRQLLPTLSNEDLLREIQLNNFRDLFNCPLLCDKHNSQRVMNFCKSAYTKNKGKSKRDFINVRHLFADIGKIFKSKRSR